MNAQLDQENHDALRDVVRIEKMISRSIWAVFVAVFMFGGWVGTLELRTQHIIRDIAAQATKVSENATRLMELGVWKATTESDRYTARDHIRFAEAVATDSAAHATRITRIEDAIVGVKESLVRIERKIDRTP